ncbi:MAG: shikimate dehydrogenase [Chitinophagales bacterium]|nr:shikimate dehydrogenase [Chitinophagales bacterium]
MKAYGLIGKSLLHSFSKVYFDHKFDLEKIADTTYQLYEIASIDELKALIQKEHLLGLNVTIPYKEKVIEHIDEIDIHAEQIGAVNCIRIRDGLKKGYNTDYIGFKMAIQNHLKGIHRSALVLGNGGAAKAVKYVLQEMGIDYLVVERNKGNVKTTSYESLRKQDFEKNTLIINCTPLGTFPNISECPNIPYQFITNRHLCVDLVYNPRQTTFLSNCLSFGAEVINGEKMLEIQAEESWKLWNEIC